MVVVTVVLLLAFVAIGFISLVPVPVRIGIQLVMALVIYFVFGATFFPFPMGDSLPISGLLGGYAWGMQNAISMGVVGFALGMLSSIAGAVAGKLVGRAKE